MIHDFVDDNGPDVWSSIWLAEAQGSLGDEELGPGEGDVAAKRDAVERCAEREAVKVTGELAEWIGREQVDLLA